MVRRAGCFNDSDIGFSASRGGFVKVEWFRDFLGVMVSSLTIYTQKGGG